jgi:hypothetical protein
MICSATVAKLELGEGADDSRDEPEQKLHGNRSNVMESTVIRQTIPKPSTCQVSNECGYLRVIRLGIDKCVI